MRIPESLTTLADIGIIEEVIRPLMSGKEAQIYLVISGGEERVAKIYKEAENRSFKNRAEYTEGRKVRNTRDQRAISKRSSHGRAQDEQAWRETEVSMIYRLKDAGVRVPVPHHFIDGVLVMELVRGEDGGPAPRLGDLSFTGDEAAAIYDHLMREVVRMLCAGVVHGDLSDFNVLMASDGPVLIDFPQSVDAAHNQNARKLLLRDVDNLHDFLSRFRRNWRRLPYAEEMWELYESNQLTPETVLTGRYRPSTRVADTSSVLSLIEDARRDEARRREVFGIKGGPGAARQQQAAAPTDKRGARPAEARQPRPAGAANRELAGPNRPAANPDARATGQNARATGQTPRPTSQTPRPTSQTARPTGPQGPSRSLERAPSGAPDAATAGAAREGGRSRRRRRGNSSSGAGAAPNPSITARPAPRPNAPGPSPVEARRQPPHASRPPRRT